MSEEGQAVEIPPAEGTAEDRSAASARRESILILLGSVAVALIVAFVRQEPLGAPGSGHSLAAAAGESAPAFAAIMAQILDALRSNVVAWRLVCLVLVGSVAGMLANRIIPGNRAGVPAAVLIGILGSAIAGWVCERAGLDLPTCISVTSVGVAFAGAVVSLIAVKLMAMV